MSLQVPEWYKELRTAGEDPPTGGADNQPRSEGIRDDQPRAVGMRRGLSQRQDSSSSDNSSPSSRTPPAKRRREDSRSSDAVRCNVYDLC